MLSECNLRVLNSSLLNFGVLKEVKGGGVLKVGV